MQENPNSCSSFLSSGDPIPLVPTSRLSSYLRITGMERNDRLTFNQCIRELFNIERLPRVLYWSENTARNQAPTRWIEKILSRLSERASSSLVSGNEKEKTKIVIHELEDLENLIKYVDALLKDATGRQIHDQTGQDWVRDLRGWNDEVSSYLSDYYDDPYSECRRSSWAVKVAIAIELKEKLWGIATRRDALSLTNLDGTKPFIDPFTDRQPCGSLPCYRTFVGRKEELHQSRNQLQNNGDHNIEVIAVMGMAGMGKTATAQKLYNETESFRKKAWISVSDQKFDVVHLLKATIESFTGEPCGLTEPSVLQEKLKEILQMQDGPVLLVLDDLWNEKTENWETFIAPFLHGAKKGSKILITTRLEEVARKSGAANPIRLNSLSEDEGWALLQEHAFSGRGRDISEKMKMIGKGIVRKCAGLPLALKVLGGLLRSKGTDREESWSEVLESSLLDYDGDQDAKAVLGSLHLSFINLTPKLRDCFQICSTYAKQNLTVGELKVLLIASQTAKDDRDADLCIEELRSRSFLETRYGSNGVASPDQEDGCIIMHDLMYDLARYVFGDAHLRRSRPPCMDPPLQSNIYSSPVVTAVC